MLTLLTATGERPQAWAICEQLMAAQTYQGEVRWVILDDGQTAQPVTFVREGWALEVIRLEPHWTPGQNTQARNLAAGLAVIRQHERVVIIEDDDYYAPEYLETAAKWLRDYDLAGEPKARYYNIATGQGRQLINAAHASLCSTVVKRQGLEALRQAVKANSKFIDIDLWGKFCGKKFLSDTRLVVGIKGMPGRGGIGCGHKEGFGQRMNLAQWLGDDVKYYKGQNL